MTAIESLPGYTEAEAMAARRGNNIVDLLSAYMLGYAKGAMPDYMAETPQPGDTVLRSEADWAALRDELHGDAR